MAKREVRIEVGSKIELTSLRTRRKVDCRIDKMLGQGGTASVFAGTLADGTHVVLKSPRYEGEHDPGFDLECELFKHFAHRNIVHCAGVGILSGSLVIAFKRVYENPLLLMTRVDDAMRRDKKARYPSLPLDTAIDMGYELLNGLEYVERLGYVHHDIKLANLLIDVASRDRPLEDSEVFGKVVRREFRGVLIDFGATRSREFLEAYNVGKAPPGLSPQITPFYAPPEAIVEHRRADGSLGRVFDPSLDVYAVALVLYAMVTGHPPYSHLRTTIDPADLESVISVKSAERRGEIEPTSLEVIQRVVFEDTRFVTGDRAAWDMAFHRFLSARLSPDPQKRGTVAQMKRDFEQLMCVKSARGDGQDLGDRAARVSLPFTQDLVKVGSGGEHPLLRAARACGMSVSMSSSGEFMPPRNMSSSGEFQRPANLSSSGEFQRAANLSSSGERPGIDARTPPPAAASSAGLDWLDEAPDTSKIAPQGGPARGAAPPRGTRRHERGALEARGGGVEPATRERTPPPAPPTRPPTPPPRTAPPRPDSGGPRPAPRPRRPEFEETQWGHATEKRQVHTGSSDQDPCRRPLPPPAEANAPHVLVSALLDEPLLLSREKKVLIGRDQSADVRIKSDLISRRHAEIGWTGHGFAVVDMGSVNGTMVNGVRIGGACHLRRDDRVSVAGFEVVVKLLTGGQLEDTGGSGGTTRVMRPELARQLGKESLQGELGQLQLKDVLELLEWKKHTGVLTVTPNGAPPAQVFLVKGQMVHAETPRGHKGLDAAVVILRVNAGRFVFEPVPVRAPRTITVDNEQVWERVRG